MRRRARILSAIALPAALLALALLCRPEPALAASADCPALFELYRLCHSQGVQAQSSKICMEASAEALARTLGKTARKNPQAAQVLVDLVCGTGCDDALSGLKPASRQEFTEAFCD
jgi:hypothetical protein